MDRTTWTALFVCVVLLMGYQIAVQHYYPAVVKVPPPKAASTQGANGAAATPSLKPSSRELVLETDLSAKQTVVLENDWIKVICSTHGGAIDRVILKKHMAEKDKPVELHQGVFEPMLNLEGWFGGTTMVGYQPQQADTRSATFVREIQPGLILKRQYVLGDGYSLKLMQTVENKSGKEISLTPYEMLVGVGAGIYSHDDERRYLGGSWSTTEQKFSSHSITEFDDGTFLFLFPKQGKVFVQSNPENHIRWAAAKNQFFVTILSCLTEPGEKVILRKVKLPELVRENKEVPDGIETRLGMPGFKLIAGESKNLEFNIYTGPKESARLSNLNMGEAAAMEFGWVGWLCKPLLTALNSIHSVVGNYGISIILLTIFIKLVLWYPQAKANENMRKMQLISPKLKEVQEKYKEDPTRMQQEMMKLYKEHNVNPVGGCLPLLVQIPIFIAFYYTLLTAVELRHASFLWISDLSKPDTLFYIPFAGKDWPFNLMPLLMAGTMFWSMHITPKTEGVDNPTQNIMKAMPLVMLVFCYNFSSALSLYWTMQNLLSVGQMYYNLKQPLPKLKKTLSQVGKRKSK